MIRILILSLFCLSCHTVKEAHSPHQKDAEIHLAPEFQSGKKYILSHAREFAFDSLMSYKSGFSLGPSHPALKGNPPSSFMEKKKLIIDITNQGLSPKAIMHYTLAEKTINSAVYDSLSEIHFKSDSLQIEKQKKQRARDIWKYNLLTVDTLHFDILTNQSLKLDTITGVLIDKEKNFDRHAAQNMNKYIHDRGLPEYWSKPRSFPNGPLKLGDAFTYLDPENTLEEAPPLDFDYLKADTTALALDEVLSELCSADKNSFVKIDYLLKDITKGKAYFDIDYYNHAYSPNSYDERIMGVGHLIYDIDGHFFSEYVLTKKNESESNLLRHRMSKRSTDIIKWTMELVD